MCAASQLPRRGPTDVDINKNSEDDDGDDDETSAVFCIIDFYVFSLQYMKEVTRLVSGETRHKLGKGLVDFAKDWMKFVSDKCERGRGMRPRYLYYIASAVLLYLW